jgi:hypothetical protein
MNSTMTLYDKDRSFLPPAGQYHVIRHKARLLDEVTSIQRLPPVRMAVTGQSRALLENNDKIRDTAHFDN